MVVIKGETMVGGVRTESIEIVAEIAVFELLLDARDHLRWWVIGYAPEVVCSEMVFPSSLRPARCQLAKPHRLDLVVESQYRTKRSHPYLREKYRARLGHRLRGF